MGKGRRRAEAGEWALDAQILRSKNWALLSQEHSTSWGHIVAEGLCTVAFVVEGEKVWWVRNSNEDQRELETDVYDIRFFEGVKKRDTTPVPKDRGTWAPVILRKGDMMYVSLPTNLVSSLK